MAIIKINELATREPLDTDRIPIMGPDGFVRAITYDQLKGSGGADPVWDTVIRTQEELDTMLASPTWLDATNVLLVGEFAVSKTLTATDQSAPIKLPSNVQALSGIKGNTVLNISIANNIGDAEPTDIPAAIHSGVTMQEIMSETPTFKKKLKDITVNILSVGGAVSGLTLMGIIGFTEISGITYKIPEGATLISNEYPCVVMCGYAANCNVVVNWAGDSGSAVTAYNGIFSGVGISCDLSNTTEIGSTTAFARCSNIVGAYDNTVNPVQSHATAVECQNMLVVGSGLVEESNNIQFSSGVSSAGAYGIAIQNVLGGENAVDGYFEFTPEGLTLNGEPVGEGGIPEAPEDGKIYARQNGAWVAIDVQPPIPTPSGGTVNVSVSQQNNNQPNPNFQERTTTTKINGDNTKTSVSYEIRDI